MLSPPTESRETFWRSLHALNVTRILIASLLFLFWGLGTAKSTLVVGPFSYFNICAAYLGLAILFGLFTLFHRRDFMVQLMSQIVVDIASIFLLYFIAGGMKGGMAILFLFPLASAAILVQMMLAFFFAALVTLFLLGESWYRFLHGQIDASAMQASLYGVAFFAAVYFLNRLAARLINQENLAIQRGQDLQSQQAINRLVISDMDDGVMVVGDDGTIFACNPSAENMLGFAFHDHGKRPKLSDISYLKPLANAFFAWKASRLNHSQSYIEPTAYLVIKPAEDPSSNTTILRDHMPALGTHLKIRFTTATAEPLPKGLSVLFLQDVAKIDDQAQQLKLASMGRLTASIAHEVRNPLAAIAHASALFGEDADTPGQQRLLKIVSDNVARLNRMIEDILNLSRKAQSQEPISLADIVSELKASFEEIHALPRGVININIPDRCRVRFDPVHLREVILNLLNNAIRYASGRSGSIHIYTVQATPSRLELHVQDDGPPITPDVRAHLFEPFYTTSRHGTGLGLYLARELCSNNGAMLDYEFHPDFPAHLTSSGRFVITFSSPDITQEGFSQ